RHLDRRDPWPRHAPITRLVARMILTISHDILGPVWVVLQEWHSADEVHAGAEHHEHRPPVAVAHQPRAHLVPTTHGTARWNASVVAMAEPHLTARPAGNALGNGRAAVLLERGGIKHAVGDALTLLALSDALADFLGMKLQTHIRLARPHPVPFPITDHAPAGAAPARRRRSHLRRWPTNQPRTARPSLRPLRETGAPTARYPTA